MYRIAVTKLLARLFMPISPTFDISGERKIRGLTGIIPTGLFNFRILAGH